jgi:hypothetical protein
LGAGIACLILVRIQADPIPPAAHHYPELVVSELCVEG